MKQKLLHKYLIIIICALAWSGEVWGIDWINNWSSAPSLNTSFYLYNVDNNVFAKSGGSGSTAVTSAATATYWTYKNVQTGNWIKTDHYSLVSSDNKFIYFDHSSGDYDAKTNVTSASGNTEVKFNISGGKFQIRSQVSGIQQYFLFVSNSKLRVKYVAGSSSNYYQWYFINQIQYNNHLAIESYETANTTVTTTYSSSNLPNTFYNQVTSYLNSTTDYLNYSSWLSSTDKSSSIRSATSSINNWLSTAADMKTAYANALTTITTAKTNSEKNNPANIAASDISAAETALEAATTTTDIANALKKIKNFDAITINGSESLEMGSTITNLASATSTRSVTCTSSNSSILSISGTTLTAVGPGEATVTVTTGSTNDTYYQCTATKTYKVYPVFRFAVTPHKIYNHGSVSASVEDSKIVGAIDDESASTTATFTANPDENCTFEGWYSDAAHTSLVSTSTTYQKQLINNEIGSTEELELYAYFKSNQAITWNNESAISTNLKVDDEQSVAATASSELAVTYTSSNSAVVTVDDSGNMKAIAPGTATITVSQVGNDEYHAASSISKTFTVTKYDQTISWNNNITDLSLIAGQTLNTNTAHASSDLPVVYSSSNSDVLDVDSSTGLLTAVSEGTATITVSQAGNYKYNAATSITRDFTIAEKMQASFTPSWWEGNNKPLSTDIKVGTSTTIELTNIATDATFTILANPTGIISWSRESNTLTVHGNVAGTTELTLSQEGSTILNGNTATYTITVSRYPNTFAIDAESKEMKVGEEWTGVVTNTGNNNTQVSYSVGGIATYDAENNKIIAHGEGSTVITFTQAATADHEAKTIDVNVTVTKVGNTLSVSLPTQAADVGGTITLAITGQNNPDAIIGTISETKQSSSVNNGSDVITYANGVITALNAGTAKITFSQPATTQYTGYESETYTITVSKIHNTITITNLNGGTATNTTMKYNKTASLAYSSTNSDTSPIVTHVSGTFTSYSAGTITSGSTAGTDIYEITQAETYKYEAGYAQFTVRVNNTDEGVAYVLYEEKEYSHGTGSGVAHTYQFSSPGETVYYRACRGTALTIYYNLYVEWSADNQSWTECQNNTSLDPDYKDDFFSCSIPETARYIRFRFPSGGTLVKYIKDVRVTRKTYVEASSDKTALGEAYTDQTKTATFTVNYSSSNGGNINISSNNPNFVTSISSVSVPVNKTAIDNSTNNNTSYICGVDGTQTFTVTYTPDPNDLGEESADITIGDLFHSQKITLTASSRKYDTTISRGSNTATATTVGGTISNAFAFSGTTTAQPSASSDDDFYYSISHTQTSSVNNGEGVISYNPATNTITGLNAGTARLTIYQKKTLKYHATSQAYDFTVTKLANNISIALSKTELDVDGTATVQLTNDDSKAGLTATFSGVEYTNESQNREGGLLSFDAETKTLTALNAGTVTVTITQPETYMYVAASAHFEVQISKLTQTLTWDNPDLETTIMQGQTLTDNTATSSVGLTPVTYSSNNTASITVDASTGVLTAVATGANVTITATQAGNYKYLPATISRQFSVFSKMTPSFTPDDNFTGTTRRIAYLSTATITVANVSSGEDFTITNGDDDVINVVRDGETITITGLQVGSTTLTLAQAGNDDYIAKTQTYTIEVFWPDDFLALTPTTTPSYAEGTYSKVFFNRDFSAVGYYSIALPFSTSVVALTGRSANADDWVAQLETVTYSQADGYTLHFNKVSGGSITANQPYVLHLGATVTNPTWTNVEVEEAEETTVTATAGYGDNVGAAGIFSDWSMTSNFTPGMSMSGLYGVVNGAGALKKGGSTAKLNAFSAYITPPSGSAGVKVQSAFTDEWGVTTYIKGLPDEGAESEANGDELYDLSGRRIDSRQQPTRGIYVRGGRRVVVK